MAVLSNDEQPAFGIARQDRDGPGMHDQVKVLTEPRGEANALPYDVEDPPAMDERRLEHVDPGRVSRSSGRIRSRAGRGAPVLVLIRGVGHGLEVSRRSAPEDAREGTRTMSLARREKRRSERYSSASQPDGAGWAPSSDWTTRSRPAVKAVMELAMSGL